MFYFYLKFIALPTLSLQKVFARQKATLFLVFFVIGHKDTKYFLYLHTLSTENIAKIKRMNNFLNEFKAFAMRGNVMDMAVGVIIGGAFGKIVSSMVDDILMPIIGVLTGGIDFKELAITIGAANIKYGMFIQNVIDFLIIAFCIFMLIKGINVLSRKKEEAPAAPAEPGNEEKLLMEIRDLLKEQSQTDSRR